MNARNVMSKVSGMTPVAVLLDTVDVCGGLLDDTWGSTCNSV